MFCDVSINQGSLICSAYPLVTKTHTELGRMLKSSMAVEFRNALAESSPGHASKVQLCALVAARKLWKAGGAEGSGLQKRAVIPKCRVDSVQSDGGFADDLTKLPRSLAHFQGYG